MFGLSIRYLGHAERWSEVVVEGKLGGKFRTFYLEKDYVLLVAGSGVDKEIVAAEIAMLSNDMLTLDELREKIKKISETGVSL